jgi:hypothetical protein
MPLKLKQELEKSAKKKGFKKGGLRWNRYVYGNPAMQKYLREEKRK